MRRSRRTQACALGPLGALKILAERTGLPEGGTKQPSKAETILVGQASADPCVAAIPEALNAHEGAQKRSYLRSALTTVLYPLAGDQEHGAVCTNEIILRRAARLAEASMPSSPWGSLSR